MMAWRTVMHFFESGRHRSLREREVPTDRASRCWSRRAVRGGLRVPASLSRRTRAQAISRLVMGARLGVLCSPQGAAFGCHGQTRHCGLRGVQTVAPSSMMAWLKSPGRRGIDESCGELLDLAANGGFADGIVRLPACGCDRERARRCRRPPQWPRRGRCWRWRRRCRSRCREARAVRQQW